MTSEKQIQADERNAPEGAPVASEVSLAKLEANRGNALKSTSPRTSRHVPLCGRFGRRLEVCAGPACHWRPVAACGRHVALPGRRLASTYPATCSGSGDSAPSKSGRDKATGG